MVVRGMVEISRERERGRGGLMEEGGGVGDWDMRSEEHSRDAAEGLVVGGRGSDWGAGLGDGGVEGGTKRCERPEAEALEVFLLAWAAFSHTCRVFSSTGQAESEEAEVVLVGIGGWLGGGRDRGVGVEGESGAGSAFHQPIVSGTRFAGFKAGQGSCDTGVLPNTNAACMMSSIRLNPGRNCSHVPAFAVCRIPTFLLT